MTKTISLAHGSGGLASAELIDQIFIRAFNNPLLQTREDQAKIKLTELTQLGDRLAFSTDSYVIDPIFFPGGDIGNLVAQTVIRQVFTLQGNDEWRGLGEIVDSGVRLSTQYREFDAELRFKTKRYSLQDDPDAHCGDVLTGRCKPVNCPLFGKKCTPKSAYGALMVSSEGACAAYYQYRQSDLI